MQISRKISDENIEYKTIPVQILFVICDFGQFNSYENRHCGQTAIVLTEFIHFQVVENSNLKLGTMSNAHDELCPPPPDDDDLTLPRASINKMIKELVSFERMAAAINLKAFAALSQQQHKFNEFVSFFVVVAFSSERNRFHRYGWQTKVVS